MIQITQLKLPYTHTAEALENKIRNKLHLPAGEKITYEIVKKSLDARKKPELFWVYSVHVLCKNEKSVMKKNKSAEVSIAACRTYQFPEIGNEILGAPPLIIGAGPAGLFAAYILVEAGFHPVLIERGKKVEDRQEDVKRFWKTGILDPSSNVQFGEGGAGTFSDGKLNTVVKDPHGRNRFVLETFVRFGAPESILYENKPHIGTDILCHVIVNMRNYLLEHGAEIHYDTCADTFTIQNGSITEVSCANGKTFRASAVVLALGHSARDTFQILHDLQFPMEAKQFAVGFRVEHPQSMINDALYGKQLQEMPAAPYKLTANFPNGRGVYSFCMCPGGYVVNASSQEQMLVVNGMSYSARDAKTANSAIIISVDQQDFTDPVFYEGENSAYLQPLDALSGMRFQCALEKRAYALAKGKIPQQLYGDFCKNVKSTSYGEFTSSTKGDTEFVNLRGLFSEDMEKSFIDGMQHFSKIIPDFDRKDAILSGVESRTSSPVRILRNEEYESSVKGIYPCGEGAGYAGGITSAAIDGIRVAEAIIKKYQPNQKDEE